MVYSKGRQNADPDSDGSMQVNRFTFTPTTTVTTAMLYQLALAYIIEFTKLVCHHTEATLCAARQEKL